LIELIELLVPRYLLLVFSTRNRMIVDCCCYCHQATRNRQLATNFTDHWWHFFQLSVL